MQRLRLPTFGHVLTLLAGTACALPCEAQTLPQDGDARKIELWAAPGLLKNPVSITMDWAGNVYVAESDRAGEAVSDTRQLGHLNGVEEDLQLRTVEDRRALIQKWIEQGAFDADYFTRTEDRVRMVRDTDGDGVADDSSVFAGGFNDAVDGIGAGVLWRDGEVLYTCIPNVWKLTDEDGDGVAEDRESISYGYGVRWCFYGHDLHGLVNGPDGRVYFSMGDRGYNIETQEGERLVGPDRGAVFRCWPDGSGLEIFHHGLRNPQELAFDEFGNLFTGDNNCDSGDRARLVYVMEGGDSGWRQDVQSLPSRGPWNREHIWELLDDPRDASRPAWTLPPIDHVGAGPSGIAYYPGTGESHAYDDTMLMVDFYGSGSTIHSFRAVRAGAGFRLADRHEYYRGTTVTDISWGPDGRLYLSDWGEGWGPNEKGNIFTITNETVHGDESAAEEIGEVASLLGEGFAGRAEGELLGLLGHRDQRIRLAAQYELAGRDGSREALAAVALDENAQLMQRVHALWAVGQVARSDPGAADRMAPLIDDGRMQIRLQAVRTLGDLRSGPADAYIRALTDEAPAVRAAAAIALGKLDHDGAMGAMLDALEANDDEDVYLRHGLAYGLALLGEPDSLIEGVEGRGRAARLGAVLALRRLENMGVSAFLADPDPGVATEAARAVYDLYLETGLPALAKKIESEIDPALMTEPFLRRAIEANVLLGDRESAARLASFGANPNVPGEWRRLALGRLAAWDQPLKREGVWGNWVDLPARPAPDAQRAVLASLGAIRAAGAGEEETLGLADALEAKYGLELDIARAMSDLVSPGKAESFRLVLLDQIAARAPSALEEATVAVLTAPADATSPRLRMRARELLVGAHPDAAMEALGFAVENGTTGERQHAVTTLASMGDPGAEAVLADLASRLIGGELDAGIALEVFDAASLAPEGSPMREAASEIAAMQPARTPGFQTLLLALGGSAERGRDLFSHHEAAQCLRCHMVRGAGGTAGPELTHIASKLSRAGLVESIVEPGATLAEGFGPVSAMPAIMTQVLTPGEVRDIVAYLAVLQDPSVGPAPEEPIAVVESGDPATAASAASVAAAADVGRSHGLGMVLLIVVGLVAIPLIAIGLLAAAMLKDRAQTR